MEENLINLVCNKAIEKDLVEPYDTIDPTFARARLKELESGYIKKKNKRDNGIFPTLITKPDNLGVCVPTNTAKRIRKLTPKECWRLMGFTDEEFEKAEKLNSNTQLFKQAGNSVVVDVIQEILKGLDLI